jgi:hypothetical protein
MPLTHVRHSRENGNHKVLSLASIVILSLSKDLFFLAHRRYGSYLFLDKKVTKNQGCVSFLALDYPNFFDNKQQVR